MADYLKSLFGGQQAPQSGDEDGNTPKPPPFALANLRQTSPTSLELLILHLHPFSLKKLKLRLHLALRPPLAQMLSSRNGTASGSERVLLISTPRPSSFPSSSSL
jgi:hypothetical protein